MMSSAPSTPYGLPRATRTTRQHLIPLDTTFDETTPATTTTNNNTSRSHTSQSLASDFLFASATIPLSPASPSSSASTSPVSKESPFAGLAPRKRSPIARLFYCFGREETARRRVLKEMEYESVGKEGHWTEY